jgi:hypothetical protein
MASSLIGARLNKPNYDADGFAYFDIDQRNDGAGDLALFQPTRNVDACLGVPNFIECLITIFAMLY